jgi:hypothetical protein
MHRVLCSCADAEHFLCMDGLSVCWLVLYDVRRACTGAPGSQPRNPEIERGFVKRSAEDFDTVCTVLLPLLDGSDPTAAASRTKIVDTLLLSLPNLPAWMVFLFCFVGFHTMLLQAHVQVHQAHSLGIWRSPQGFVERSEEEYDTVCMVQLLPLDGSEPTSVARSTKIVENTCSPKYVLSSAPFAVCFDSCRQATSLKFRRFLECC